MSHWSGWQASMDGAWPAKENNTYLVTMIVQSPYLPHEWRRVEIVLDASAVKQVNSSEAIGTMLYFGFKKAIQGQPIQP